jgi:hypothetical protein
VNVEKLQHFAESREFIIFPEVDIPRQNKNRKNQKSKKIKNRERKFEFSFLGKQQVAGD